MLVVVVMAANIEKIKKKIRGLTDEVDEWHDKADHFEKLANENKVFILCSFWPTPC